MMAEQPSTITSPIRPSRSLRRFPRSRAAARPTMKTIPWLVISLPSTKESAALANHTTAGAPKGYLRRSSRARTTPTIATTSAHAAAPRGIDESLRAAVPTAPTTAATTNRAATPCVRSACLNRLTGSRYGPRTSSDRVESVMTTRRRRRGTICGRTSSTSGYSCTVLEPRDLGWDSDAAARSTTPSVLMGCSDHLRHHGEFVRSFTDPRGRRPPPSPHRPRNDSPRRATRVPREPPGCHGRGHGRRQQFEYPLSPAESGRTAPDRYQVEGGSAPGLRRGTEAGRIASATRHD